MGDKDKAGAKLKAIIEKYRVKLNEKQFAQIQILRDNALAYDPTGKIWLSAVDNLEKVLEQ